ncbi:MAG: sigma 54-interacting transcriptional regulator [Acidobacteriota bacterium]
MTDRRGVGRRPAEALDRLRGDIVLCSHTNARVLNTRDGVHKRRIAALIHQLSPRASAALVTVQCGVLSESVLDGELEGWTRPRGLPADPTPRGTLETASKGTLLLDDVGQMTLRQQSLLHRFLEGQSRGKRRPDSAFHGRVRIIATATGDLYQAVRQGRFLQDLFYRLNVLHLVVPRLTTGQLEALLGADGVAGSKAAAARPRSMV